MKKTKTIPATNELPELQSVNEVLKTGMEELQSDNEKLSVVNQEMIGLNAQLKEAGNYAEAIIATIREPLLVLDSHLKVKSANNAFYKTFGVNEQETAGRLLYNLGDNQWNIPEFRKVLENILSKKILSADFEVMYKFPDVGERLILLNAREITREETDEKLILLSIEDVTEERKHQQKEKELLVRFENLVLQAPMAMAVFKGKEYIVEIANEHYLKIAGKQADFIGKQLFLSMPELKAQGIKNLMDDVMQTGKPYYGNEWEAYITKDNKSRQGFYNFVFQPTKENDGTVTGIMVVANEVTEQVVSRRKVEESEKRFRNVVEKAPYPICILKGEDMVLDVANEPVFKVWGVNKEALGKPFLEIIPEMKDQPFMGYLLDVFHTGVTHYGVEEAAHFTRENGEKETIYFNFVYQPYHEDDGNISGVMVLATDVTENVLARKKIEDSEQRYSEMIYSSPNLIAILKGDNFIIEIANDAILEIWGKGKDVIGKPYLAVLPELVEQGIGEMLKQVYTTGVPYYANELPVTINRNGKSHFNYYSFNFQPQRSATGEIEGIAIIALEVSPQAELNLKIKDSEERFRNLADDSPMFVYLIEPNAEATISYWNKTWLNYTGQSFEEALGNSWNGIIHPDDVPGVMEVYVPAFEKRQPYFLPGIRVKRHDGVYRWHMVKSNPRYLSNGEFMGFIGVAVDIHEQKLAEQALKESERHFRLMADLMPAKISNANAGGDVTYFNKEWLEFSGYSFEELKDFGYHKMLHPDELEEFQQRLQHAAETGSVLEMEMQFLDKKGNYIWHLNLASPVKDEEGNVKMWVGVTTDIQAQKKQREILEEAVTERTGELQKANEDLLKMNKELEAFTYVSSHDLQEPLRKIQIFAGRMLEKENQNLSGNGKEMLQRMQEAAERMRTLIQNLLAFASLGTSERKFEKTDLNKIIEEVKQELNTIIEEKQAMVEVKEMCDVKVIAFQFRQLMLNLISNALKFSKPGIPPHITIESSVIKYSNPTDAKLLPGKAYCHITIIDNGIGFEKEYAEKIFEVFQKLHIKEEYAGTGIGLAIVKKIVENHNGIITATSDLGKGARFDIYIPA